MRKLLLVLLVIVVVGFPIGILVGRDGSSTSETGLSSSSGNPVWDKVNEYMNKKSSSQTQSGSTVESRIAALEAKIVQLQNEITAIKHAIGTEFSMVGGNRLDQLQQRISRIESKLGIWNYGF